jgi:hypothetical protein
MFSFIKQKLKIFKIDETLTLHVFSLTAMTRMKTRGTSDGNHLKICLPNSAVVPSLNAALEWNRKSSIASQVLNEGGSHAS